MTKRCASLLFALLLSVAVAAPSFAQETAPPAMPAAGPPPAPVAWSNLSPDQQRLLSRFGSQWSTLPTARQRALAVDVTRRPRSGPATFPALAGFAARAAPRVAPALAEIPGAPAGRAGQGAREFPPLSAVAARAAADAARAVAQRQPRAASADDHARARAAAEAAAARRGPASGAAPPAPLILRRRRTARPHRDRTVAHVHAPGRHLEPVLVPAAARLDVGEEGGCVGAQHF